LRFQPLPRDRLVPFSYPDGRVIQQSARSSCDTRQFRFTGYLACHPAQTHRAALVDSNH
jgi:hypothetical protein